MVEFKTSFNNQWYLDWLKTQVDTIRERTSTIDLKDTCVIILIVVAYYNKEDLFFEITIPPKKTLLANLQ